MDSRKEEDSDCPEFLGELEKGFKLITRTPGEGALIGDDILVIINKVDRHTGKVSLAINAPKHILIRNAETARRMTQKVRNSEKRR